jgi:hypothetical protein
MMILFLMALTANSSAAACLDYDKKVQVLGTLSEQTFPEEPNYEDAAKGDHPASYFFITPETDLCVSAGRSDDEPARSIESMQLIFSPTRATASYNALRPSLGKQVSCAGRLWPAISGHHHTPTMLADAVCTSP